MNDYATCGCPTCAAVWRVPGQTDVEDLERRLADMKRLAQYETAVAESEYQGRRQAEGERDEVRALLADLKRRHYYEWTVGECARVDAALSATGTSRSGSPPAGYP